MNCIDKKNTHLISSLQAFQHLQPKKSSVSRFHLSETRINHLSARILKSLPDKALLCVDLFMTSLVVDAIFVLCDFLFSHRVVQSCCRIAQFLVLSTF